MVGLVQSSLPFVLLARLVVAVAPAPLLRAEYLGCALGVDVPVSHWHAGADFLKVVVEFTRKMRGPLWKLSGDPRAVDDHLYPDPALTRSALFNLNFFSGGSYMERSEGLEPSTFSLGEPMA